MFFFYYYYSAATQNPARTIQLLICILDQVPICMSNSYPLLKLIIFSPLRGENRAGCGDISWCHGVIKRGQPHERSNNPTGLQNKEASNKKNRPKTYLYCETAICCRFSQVDVVEFSETERSVLVSDKNHDEAWKMLSFV